MMHTTPTTLVNPIVQWHGPMLLVKFALQPYLLNLTCLTRGNNPVPAPTSEHSKRRAISQVHRDFVMASKFPFSDKFHVCSDGKFNPSTSGAIRCSFSAFSVFS
jgi:hypothetical protein